MYIIDQKKYDTLSKTCPVVDARTRLGWLIIKKHFGPISATEEAEFRGLWAHRPKDWDVKK